MHDIVVLFVHLIVTVVRLIKPGGLRAVVAESALTRHQILILNRSRKRAPNLRVSDRIIAGLCTLLMHPSRVRRCGFVLKPSTLLHFHHLLTKRTWCGVNGWFIRGNQHANMNPPSDETTSTVAYYDAHAAEFCENTVSVDMSELYAPFLRDIPAGGRILDA